MEPGTRVQIDWPGKQITLPGLPRDGRDPILELHGLYGRVVAPPLHGHVTVHVDDGPLLRIPLEHAEEYREAADAAELDQMMSKGRRSLADLQERVGWDPNSETNDTDDMWRYIEALEGQVVGQAMAMDTIGRSWRPPPR